MKHWLSILAAIVLSQGPVLPGPGTGGGTPVIVQSNSAVCTAVSCPVAFQHPVATGNLIGCYLFDGGGQSIPVTCIDGVSAPANCAASSANAYTAATFAASGGNPWGNMVSDNDTTGASFATAGSSAAFNLLFCDGGINNTKRIEIVEFGGAACSLDQTAFADQNSLTPSSTNANTTTKPIELLVGFIATAGIKTITPGSGYTAQDPGTPAAPNSRIALAYRLVTVTGTYAATFGLSAAGEAGTILTTIKC